MGISFYYKDQSRDITYVIGIFSLSHPIKKDELLIIKNLYLSRINSTFSPQIIENEIKAICEWDGLNHYYIHNTTDVHGKKIITSNVLEIPMIKFDSAELEIRDLKKDFWNEIYFILQSTYYSKKSKFYTNKTIRHYNLDSDVFLPNIDQNIVTSKTVSVINITPKKSLTTPVVCLFVYAYLKSTGWNYDDFEKITHEPFKSILKVFKGRYNGEDDWLKKLNNELKYFGVSFPKRDKTIHDYFRYKKLFQIKEAEIPKDIISINIKKVDQYLDVVNKNLKSCLTSSILNQFKILKTDPAQFFFSDKEVNSSKKITIN